MTNIPADKTAKRVSTASLLVRGGVRIFAPRAASTMPPPADRIAVRS